MTLTRASQRTVHPRLRKFHDERHANFQNRVADSITGFAGSMWFVYIHIAIFAYWLLTKGFPFNDPFPFGLLTMIVSLEAIFLSTFVMISQNRADEHRAVLANHEWEVVQEEEQQNEELLNISRQLLDLTQQVHTLTTELHETITSAPAD
jgi:uncharacterized membrane protein